MEGRGRSCGVPTTRLRLTYKTATSALLGLADVHPDSAADAASPGHRRGSGSQARYGMACRLICWCDHFCRLAVAADRFAYKSHQASPRSAKRQRSARLRGNESLSATQEVDAAITSTTARLRARLVTADAHAATALPTVMARLYVAVAPAMLIESETSSTLSGEDGYLSSSASSS